MLTTRQIVAIIGLCCLSFMISPPVAADDPITFERDTLVIESARGDHIFRVDLAVTRHQHQRGLMYRRKLAADEGMLFDFGIDRPAAMWMRNTFIPLDMLFIRRDGEISHIAEYTVPLSETTIASHGPVRGVLELNAGTVDALGIAIGDHVVHSAFSMR